MRACVIWKVACCVSLVAHAACGMWRNYHTGTAAVPPYDEYRTTYEWAFLKVMFVCIVLQYGFRHMLCGCFWCRYEG